MHLQNRTAYQCIYQKNIWLFKILLVYLYQKYKQWDMKGIYYIKNTINESEMESQIVGYFTDLESAKESLKYCADWYRPNGTGKIYYVEFGLNKKPKLIYEKI